MRRHLLLSIVLGMFAATLLAQTTEDLFYDALYFYEEEEDFQEARYLYYEVLSKEPNNANAKYLIGMCYN